MERILGNDSLVAILLPWLGPVIPGRVAQVCHALQGTFEEAAKNGAREVEDEVGAELYPDGEMPERQPSPRAYYQARIGVVWRLG